MKKIVILITSLSIYSSLVFAQATPNAGFENWTHNAFPNYDTPDGWDNLNPSTGGLGTITCYKATATGDYYNGVAAVKLITKSIIGITANGIVTTGTINTTSQSISGGIPYTLRPDSITGWYKYSSVSGDNGFAEILLLGSGGISDTVGHARFITPASNVSNWTRFSMAIDYYNANPVVKSIWILSSSKDAVVHNVGSTAFFDDVDLVFVPTSIAEQNTQAAISVSPNPAADYLMIRNSANPNSIFMMQDLEGRKVMEVKLNGENLLDVSSLKEGQYIYSIVDENRIIKTGKVLINR